MRKLGIIVCLLISQFGFSARAEGPMDLVSQLRYMLSIGALQGAMAKELCSCRYVSGLTMNQCISHMGIPSAAAYLMSINDDVENARVEVTPFPTIVALPYITTAEARFDRQHPYRGCRLTRSHLENQAQ